MSGPAHTPMFEQYHALKAVHPDAILLFRMGDFYELFFEDAVIAARELELTLTSRNKNDPEPIPMAGVPHHAVASYIQRLVEAGHRVAIADQVEDPALAKGLVKREIVRVVTPGVVFDPSSLDARVANWLAGVVRTPEGFGLAFLDASTGDLRTTTVSQAAHAGAELQRLQPRELLVGPGVRVAELGPLPKLTASEVEPAAWRPDEARRELCDTLGVASLEGFGVDDADPSVRAAGAVLRYARTRLGGRLGNVHALRPYRANGFLVMDHATQRNLELVRTLIGNQRRGSLLHLLDQCATPMGSRLLGDWLVFPLLDPPGIHARQAGVEGLVEDAALRADLRLALREVADIERIGARVAQGTAHARDLAALSRSLAAVPKVAALAARVDALAPHLPTDECPEVREDLATWLVDDPPITLTEGGLIRTGAHAELDELVQLSLDGEAIIDRLEAKERTATDIPSLKIRRNRVFGYYIEITTANLHRVPDRYLRKQTLSNCERYVTPELREIEEKVLGADERRKGLEYELFCELRERVGMRSARLSTLAKRLAALDVLTALAEVATRHRWVRPEVDDSRVLDIVGGRHPMVEAALDEERFVPNDLRLDPAERSLVVLTGPNMAGKSTVLRQVALIALLAQVGSYVPADSARIGLCDRIFTRVGAADDLRKGQSTFMVEMAETAAILHHATARSLVVLDEIGRGTSTYDGLAIAWSVAEDLHDRIGCRTLFATHYHELCELSETRPRVANLQVAVSELEGEILFLRRLREGGASRSYGIQCARLAGLPAPVIQRATTLLTRFEKHAPESERRQLGLFAAPPPAPEPRADVLRERLRGLDPDALSPREAHAALYELRGLLEG